LFSLLEAVISDITRLIPPSSFPSFLEDYSPSPLMSFTIFYNVSMANTTSFFVWLKGRDRRILSLLSNQW
jgi:hypothetical protein